MIKRNNELKLSPYNRKDYLVAFFFLSKKKMILYKFLKQSLDQPAIKRREEKENRLVVIYQAHPPRDLSSD